MIPGDQMSNNDMKRKIRSGIYDVFSRVTDADVLFCLKKNLTLFWTEPEHIIIKDSTTREGKDGLK